MTTDQEKTKTPASSNGQTAETKPSLDTHRHPQSKFSVQKKIVIIALLVVALVLGWAGYQHFSSGKKPSRNAAAAQGQNQPVPVVEGIVSARDVPIYLDGLGTVQAFNTVVVHTRVDGELIKVAFQEGQDVKAGAVLAQLDPAPYQATYDQARAKKAQDAAQLENAHVDLQRYADLLKTDSITQQIFDTQKALVSQFEAAIKADDAALESAQVNLNYATISSPIGGRVGIRQVDVGNIVRASDASGIVTVTQLRPISVLFTLPEQSLSKLHDYLATETNYAVLAVSRDNTNVLDSGKLAVIDNQIDTSTGTIKLKATFANENLRLWPGQFINTRLLLTTRRNSASVPASVVQRGPDGAFAFVIQDDQTVKMQPLKVAQIENGWALIDSGLTPGERVVVDGQYKLQPGSHVKPVDSSGKADDGDAAPDAKNHSGKKS